MPDGYSWSEVRGGGGYRLPGPEHLGWWAGVAMVVSILLHVIVFFALDRMKIALGFEEAREMRTGPVNINQVEVRPMDIQESLPPEDVLVPPNDSAALLEEVDLLELLPKDQEIDMNPEVEVAEYAIQLGTAVEEGDPAATALELMTGLEVDADMPELGRMDSTLPPAAVGQVTVDPGAVSVEEPDLGKFTDDLLKRGAEGNVERGALDGIASLDDLIGLPANVLVNKKTMLPSDLLFEFNSDELRESARVGLMKLAMLIDRNPGLYCWIEGHTDLVGGEAFNLDLSQRRAAAVKRYLVESMRMDDSKIVTRGFGKSQPLVVEGDAGEQAPNRRVEIKMRKTPPRDEPVKVTPKRVPTPEETAPPKAEVMPEPPEAVLVKPKRALPVEEAPAPSPPKAKPIEEAPAPRANPVPEPPLRAEPVEEGAPRAEPVEEEAPPRAAPRAEPVRE